MIFRYLFFIFLPNFLVAQTVTSIQNTKTGESFPRIQLENNLIESKINTILQLSHLGHSIAQSKYKPFERIKTENQQSGLFYTNYKLTSSTPPNVLSIPLSGIKKYREIRPFYLVDNFDLRTGNKIFIEDILTEKGLKLIHQQNQIKASEIIKETLQKKTNTPQQTDILNNCLLNLSIIPIESLVFQLTKTGISFSYPECTFSKNLNKQIKIEYTFKELKTLLTSYSKSLLSNRDTPVTTSNVKAKLFSGNIGKKQIKAFLKNIYPDGSVQILYRYENQPTQLIEWYGLIQNNKLELREQQRDKQNKSKPITTAKINGTLKHNTLFGIWKHIKTGQTLPFKLITNE